MSKARAIKIKCLDCSGDSKKDVTVCQIVACPLWPFRFGYSSKDQRYKKRMEAAARNYPTEYRDLMNLLGEAHCDADSYTETA
jgi:hypothetical protein